MAERTHLRGAAENVTLLVLRIAVYKPVRKCRVWFESKYRIKSGNKACCCRRQKRIDSRSVSIQSVPCWGVCSV